MKSIMENPLVKNIFSVIKKDEDETERFKCMICDKWSGAKSVKNLGILLVEGSSYSVYSLGIKKSMSREFSNFKNLLERHKQPNS